MPISLKHPHNNRETYRSLHSNSKGETQASTTIMRVKLAVPMARPSVLPQQMTKATGEPLTSRSQSCRAASPARWHIAATAGSVSNLPEVPLLKAANLARLSYHASELESLSVKAPLERETLVLYLEP